MEQIISFESLQTLQLEDQGLAHCSLMLCSLVHDLSFWRRCTCWMKEAGVHSAGWYQLDCAVSESLNNSCNQMKDSGEVWSLMLLLMHLLEGSWDIQCRADSAGLTGCVQIELTV